MNRQEGGRNEKQKKGPSLSFQGSQTDLPWMDMYLLVHNFEEHYLTSLSHDLSFKRLG